MSDEELESLSSRSDAGVDEAVEDRETADEVRARMARKYLDAIREDEGGDEERLAKRLRVDAGETATTQRALFDEIDFGTTVSHKAHKLCATSGALSADESRLAMGAKDCRVGMWDVETGARLAYFAGARKRMDCGGHFDAVTEVVWLTPSVVVSSGADSALRIWDVRAPQAGQQCTAKQRIKQGHVTCMVQDPAAPRIYSGSTDKGVRVWTMDELSRGSVREEEVLFGHTETVTSMACCDAGLPVSGGADGTVRLWKMDRSTHLAFTTGHQGSASVDAVACLTASIFASGATDKKVCLWHTGSKNPLVSLELTGWVSAMSAPRHSDTLFVATQDDYSVTAFGARQLPKIKNKMRCDLEEGDSFETKGIVNKVLCGKQVVVAIHGKETRHGRWFYDKGAENGFTVCRTSGLH